MYQRITRAAFLIFAVAFLVRVFTGAVSSRDFFPPSEFLCLALSGVAFVFALASRPISIPSFGLLTAGLLFLAFYAVALMRAENYLEAVLRASGILQILLFGGAAFLLGQDPSLRRAFIWLCVGVSVAAAATAFWQRFVILPQLAEAVKSAKIHALQSPIMEPLKRRIMNLEPFGYFVLPNMLCALLVAMIVVVSGMIKVVKERRERILLFAVFLVLFSAGLLSKVRGAWALLVGSVLLYFLARWKGVKWVVVLGVAFALLLIVLSLTPLAEEAPSSVRVRLLYWRGALQIAAHNPLGTGLTSFRNQFMKIQSPLCEPVKSPHNAFLLYLSEGGWILGVAVLMLYIFGFLSLRRKLPVSFKPDRMLLMLVLFSGVVSVAFVYYLPHHVSVLKKAGESALLTVLSLLVVPWLLWRFNVDTPLWAGKVAAFVLVGSTLIDFSHLETNYGVFAAVWVALYLDGRGVNWRRIKGFVFSVAVVTAVIGMLAYTLLANHFIKVKLGGGTGWRGLRLLTGTPKERKLGQTLVNSGLTMLKEAINEMPSDTIARKFDLEIRYGVWLKTGKGVRSLKARAEQMLKYWTDYRSAYSVLTQIAASEGRVWDAVSLAFKRAQLSQADPRIWKEMAIVCWTGWLALLRSPVFDLAAPLLPALARMAAKKALQLDSLKKLAFPHLTDEQRRLMYKIVMLTGGIKR